MKRIVLGQVRVSGVVEGGAYGAVKVQFGSISRRKRSRRSGVKGGLAGWKIDCKNGLGLYSSRSWCSK